MEQYASHQEWLDVRKELIERVAALPLSEALSLLEMYGLDPRTVLADGECIGVAIADAVYGKDWLNGERIEAVTSAPPAYDGFGTVTLRTHEREGWKCSYRTVSMLAEHEQWQRSRYASGLYACVSHEQLDEWIVFGLA